MIAALILAATIVSAPRGELVLGSGERIRVEGEIRVEGAQVVFRTSAGRLYSIALEEVDLDATAAEPRPKREARREPEKNDPRPLPERRLAVSPEKRERLLRALKDNHAGTPAPEQKALSAAGLEEERRRREEQRAVEEQWRARSRAIRELIARSRDAIESLQARERRLEDEILALLALGHDPGHQLYQRDATRAEIDRARAALRAAEASMRALEEEARRAGALPGWLRD